MLTKAPKSLSPSEACAAITEAASGLHLLLDSVRPEHGGTQGVLTLARSTLPGFLANMRGKVYLKAGLLSTHFAPAELRPAGWASVLEHIGEDGRKFANAPNALTAEQYEAGSRWATARVREDCPARGEGAKEIPLNFLIARKAEELALLVNQIMTPADDLPGSAVLVLLQSSLAPLTRNMNAALYNKFGLLPPVENLAYLPPADWELRINNIRLEASADDGTAEKDPLKYHYKEGVRWTCVRYRTTFHNLTQSPE